MLTASFIKQKANEWQTTELNVRREYLQHLFLSYLYKQKESRNILFKGGTALRILYGSPRFSEDLDFSAGLKPKIIESVVLETMEGIEREGITASFLEAKETSGGYLAIIEFRLNGVKLTLTLEISLREKEGAGEIILIAGDFIPSFTVISYPREKLIGEKIQALLTRKKPRDFYDLYFLLRANLMSLENKKVLPLVFTTVKKTKIDFEKELKIFLPKSHWGVINDFKNNLQREIGRYV